MNRARLLLLGAALIAALLAAYLAQGILQQPAPAPTQPVVEKIDTVDVLVAARDVARGEKLSSQAVQWVRWPRDIAVGGRVITKDAQPDAVERISTARALQSMVAGEPIIEGKIIFPKDRSFMSAVLPAGMRAISVAISEVSAASGFILPNDRVDVILTRRSGRSDSSGGGDRPAESITVLNNVRVLAINQTFDTGDSASLKDGRTAVLELYPNQAEVLASIQSSGTISLVLRSLADSGGAGGEQDKPALSDAFQRPGGSGPLIIRYGIEIARPTN